MKHMKESPENAMSLSGSPGASRTLSRRAFLKLAGVSLTALGAGCQPLHLERWFQRYFRELKPDEKINTLRQLEAEYLKDYGKAVHVADTPPVSGVLFGYGLDISRCIGCRRCVYACVLENNQSRQPQIHYITVLRMPKDKGVDLLAADAYYHPPLVPEADYFYFPVACQQCRTPQCTMVCPVKATWQEPDGITVVDYNWCIGCRYCMAACPYGARRFNWSKPGIPTADLVTETHYLGNRPRYKGVVEKCTFCIQRVRQGRYPACVEICPVGARKFGNLLDPDGEMQYLLREKRVFIFKEELNTQPKFYYFYAV